MGPRRLDFNWLDLLSGERYSSHLLDETKSDCRKTMSYATKTLIYQTVTWGLFRRISSRSRLWEGKFGQMFLY